MGNEKNVLLVCRGLSEIYLLQRFLPRPDCRYIVASDDLRVHLEMEKYPWVEEVCYLEQMESLYPVVSDVFKFLAITNQWLSSLGQDPRGIPQELLFWISCCEGGKTTQRIQDVLLLIRSYQYLIDTYKISSIIILSHPQAGWEDDVLIKTGRSKGLEVRTIGRFRFSVLKGRLLSLIKLIAREPYYILSILRAQFHSNLKSYKPHFFQKEIVFQLCIPDEKFVEDVVPLMKALKTRDYNPVTLYWRAAQAIGKIQEAGLRGEELETYVPSSSLWEAPYRVWVTWRQARIKRHEFRENPGLQYRGISLGPLLWSSVWAFFGEELSQRYRLWMAAKNYFANHSPQAMKLWGSGELPEGAIFYHSLQEHQKPLIFFSLLHYFDSPYESEYAFTDLLLAAGDSQKEYLEKNGVPAERIVSVGMSRYDHLEDFQKEYSPSQSRAHLKVPGDFQNYVLFDPNYTLRGYLTIQEQSLVTEALLNFAREHPSVAVMIKPHPAHCSGWLEELIDYFSLPNVFLLDKNMMPYHALNAADLLITKCSTIALEAMLFKKPVVSVVLDGGQRFRIYGDAVESADSVASLIEILTKMVTDANWRKRWVENQMVNQAIFLKHYFGNHRANAAQLAAEALDKFIQMKNG